MRLPIEIEGILFKRADGKIQYLLLKRHPEKGGFWQPVTGGLEEGETKIEKKGLGGKVDFHHKRYVEVVWIMADYF